MVDFFPHLSLNQHFHSIYESDIHADYMWMDDKQKHFQDFDYFVFDF